MPGSPRDTTDALLRELRDIRREVERLKRHRHPIGRNTADTVGFEIWMGDFGRAATQSITDAAGMVNIQLDSCDVRSGTEFMELAGAGDLRILFDGIYFVEWSCSFPSLAVNGVFATGAQATFGDSSSGGASHPDYRFTTTSQTGKGTPRMARLIACDADTVITFTALQTSGANRNVNVYGTIARISENENLWRSL